MKTQGGQGVTEAVRRITRRDVAKFMLDIYLVEIFL